MKYKNVTPGKTYKVTGTLYEKVTDKDGKAWSLALWCVLVCYNAG